MPTHLLLSKVKQGHLPDEAKREKLRSSVDFTARLQAAGIRFEIVG